MALFTLADACVAENRIQIIDNPLLPNQLDRSFAPKEAPSIFHVLQFGNELTVELQVKGSGNYASIHQVGMAHTVQVQQHGSENGLTIFQRN